MADKDLAPMTVAELRTILEHLPDHLDVQIAGRGVLVSVRRHFDQLAPSDGVFLDIRGPQFKGRCRDARTLRVQLERLAETA